MLALLHKQRTGEGQWVDLACTEAAVTLNGPALLDWTVNQNPSRQAVQPSSNRSQFAAMAPHGIYPCSGDDNWIAISCRHQADWQLLCQLIEQHSAAPKQTDPQADPQSAAAPGWHEPFADEAYRLAHQDSLDQAMQAWTCQFDKFALQQQLQALPIPAAAVQKPAERIEQDPSTADFGLWPTVNHSAMGDVRVDGMPVHMSVSDWQMQHGAPCLGEHNHDVLSRLLGLSTSEIDQLAAEGVL